MGAKRLIKSLLKFLQKQKWAASFVGILAVAVVIWFMGRKLRIGRKRPLRSAKVRLLIILVVAVGWVVVLLWKHFRAKKANQQMTEELAAQGPSADEEVATMKEDFQKALQVLKKSRVKGALGSQYLYELPWYMIIGPPGSGKTTALLNSGLDFPLADRLGKDPVRGVGGTRNCDWWFTNDAVLLDTAGRYTTQDSQQEVDSAAWSGFLGLLKKYRPRRPINGILVAISLSDLMTQSPEERERHAHTVRQRIQELYKELGVQVPIYLTFTKADLVAGFMEFFDDMGKEQRGQVWGMTFSPQQLNNPEAIREHFAQEYQALLERLNHRLLWRLNQERDVTRRSLVNGFPQQMAGLQEPIADFLQKAFIPSRFEEPMVLRGVYFTSGTQEGTPIDRIVAALANTFGLGRRALAAQSGTGRSYFITRLLRDVIFEEEDFAGANRRFERQRRWLRAAGYVGIAAILIGVVFAWSVSYTRNEQYVSKLENRIERYREAAPSGTPPRDVEKLLPVLQYARDIATVYGEDHDDTPWLVGMGLYQGYKLGNAAENAYHRILQQLWLPLIKRDLEAYIRTGSEHHSKLRQVLNIYLMLGHPDRFNANVFKRWMKAELEEDYPDDVKTRNRLEQHLTALLAAKPPAQNLDEQLIADARQIICQIPLPDQIYSRLQEEAVAAGLSGFELRGLGRSAQKVFVARKGSAGSVGGLYTADGYQRIFREKGLELARTTIQENRELCESNRRELERADAEQLMREVQDLYVRDYIDQWKRFLSGIELTNLRTMSQGVDALEELSGGNSPLKKLLEAVKRHTKLASGEDDSDTAAKVITQEFEPLHKLLEKGDSESPEIEVILTQLQELYGYLYEIADARRVNETAFQTASQRMSGGSQDAIAKLRRRSRLYPDPVNQILKSGATQTWGLVLASARGHINSVWQSTALRECRRVTGAGYPFNPDSSQEVALLDFGRFFGTDGTMEQFTKRYLQPFVRTDNWRARSKDGRDINISGAALGQFRRAARIRSTFFASGGQEPSVQFRVQPYRLSSALDGCTLRIDGADLQYQFGPRPTKTFTWPGPGGGGARISCGRGLSKTYDGSWALFRLLDEADVSKAGGGLRVKFGRRGLWAEYTLQPNSAINPFEQRTINRFSCPGNL